MRAIRLEGGRAVIGEYCRACGRCASVCPQRAVSIAIEDPDFLEKAYSHIRAYVKHD
jgi:UDP-glucose 4-epimerase